VRTMGREKIIRRLSLAAGVSIMVLCVWFSGTDDSHTPRAAFLNLSLLVLPAFVLLLLVGFSRYWWALPLSLWFLFCGVLGYSQSLAMTDLLFVVAAMFLCVSPFLVSFAGGSSATTGLEQQANCPSDEEKGRGQRKGVVERPVGPNRCASTQSLLGAGAGAVASATVLGYVGDEYSLLVELLAAAAALSTGFLFVTMAVRRARRTLSPPPPAVPRFLLCLVIVVFGLMLVLIYDAEGFGKGLVDLPRAHRMALAPLVVVGMAAFGSFLSMIDDGPEDDPEAQE
jgi:hypothetical protein